MSNGIGRLRTMGIAAQPTFGTPASSATFVLPLLNAPQFNAVVNKVLNEAALGSAYMTNDIMSTSRFTEIPLEFKVDEDQLPLLFKQRFTITSGTYTGETAVYQHTLAFQNNTNTWYTLFLQDDQLQDYIVPDVLLDNLDFTLDQDFVRIQADAIGSYPTASNVTNSITQPKEFVGRMVGFLQDDVPGTATATSILSMTGNFDFGLNSEDTKFGLGTLNLAANVLTADKYTFNVVKLKPNTDFYDDNTAGTTKQFQVNIVSTDRFVTGSVSSTRPSILINVPRAKIENYTEEPDLNELTQENFDLTALKPVGVAGTPLTLTVVNATASY